MNNREPFWKDFIDQERLTEQQAEQFKRYLTMLTEWNKKINLTNIIDPKEIILYHFQDSLRIDQFVDFSSRERICDVGTGAGFPGIPLKICYPHLSLVLIEVNRKKRAFLEALFQELTLEKVDISSLDWRTFLRKTDYKIDLFLARASLKTEELVRMFKPDCIYNNARLIYWASHKWSLGKKDEPFFDKEESYTIGDKRRRFIFFSYKGSEQKRMHAG